MRGKKVSWLQMPNIEKLLVAYQQRTHLSVLLGLENEISTNFF